MPCPTTPSSSRTVATSSASPGSGCRRPPISTQARSAASASGRHSALRPAWPAGSDRGRGYRGRIVRLQCHGDRHRGAPPGAGADRGGQQRQLGDRGPRPAGDPRQGGRYAACSSPTMRPWRGPSGCTANVSSARKISRRRSSARWRIGPRCSTCWSRRRRCRATRSRARLGAGPAAAWRLGRGRATLAIELKPMGILRQDARGFGRDLGPRGASSLRPVR